MYKYRTVRGLSAATDCKRIMRILEYNYARVKRMHRCYFYGNNPVFLEKSYVILLRMIHDLKTVDISDVDIYRKEMIEDEIACANRIIHNVLYKRDFANRNHEGIY